ncbi:unnamed protein product [Aphanomyces euteiches]|nr:hypothetical protein AeRB84_002744 [Aphanomyces euteiches]
MDPREEERASFRERLVHFYSKHCPAKIQSIDSLLAAYEGEEEALIQKIHLKYGVRDVESDVAVDEIFENERYSLLTRTFGSTYITYPSHLMVLDRKRWSTASGTPSSQEMHEIEPQLPEGYEYTGPWEIDSTYVKCDREGWTYAFDFSNFQTMLNNNESRAKPTLSDYVRRRRWIRPRRKKVESLPSSAPPQVPSSPRSRIAPITDEVISASPFRYFLPTISMEEHETAWKYNLNMLYNLHTKINHARAGRLLVWKKNKAQLRAQLKALRRDDGNEAKLDQLKRAIWFPIEKGYIWRGSSSGLFMGVHDFWLEHLSLSFGVALANSVVEISFRGELRGRFDRVKVKGDKGTRIPDAKWTQVTMDLAFVGSWKMRFIDGRWTFLSDQSKAVDFTKMNLQYKGGLGVPDGLAQLVINEIVTNYVKDILVESFPQELAALVQEQSHLVQMAGELTIDGLHLTNTVDASCHSTRAQTEYPEQVLQVLDLTPAQMNLLMCTRQYSGLEILFPSLASFATYLRQCILDRRLEDKQWEELTAQWISTWDRILELVLLQRHLNPRGKGSELAPIEFGKFIDHAKCHVLEKKLPVRIQLSNLICHVHLSTLMDTLSAWALQTTRVASTLGARVMGIRLGRKDKGPQRRNTEDPHPAMVDVQRFLRDFKTWLASGVLQSIKLDVEGKLTGIEQTSDARIRLQARDFHLKAKGPVDWTSSLAWVTQMGQLVCSTTADTVPGVQVVLETKAGEAVATSVMTDIDSSLIFDVGQAAASSCDTVVWTTHYGHKAGGIHMTWHPALKARVAVGMSNVVAHLRACLDTAVLLLRQRETMHETTWSWLHKMISTGMKYCASDALLIAWSVSMALDADGMFTIRAFEDHPQPVLFFDQIQLVRFLDDVDDIVNFSIQLQEQEDK